MWFRCRDRQCTQWELSQQTCWCLVSVLLQPLTMHYDLIPIQHGKLHKSMSYNGTWYADALDLVWTPSMLWHLTYNITMLKSFCVSIPHSVPRLILQSEHFHCFYGFNVCTILFLLNVVHAGSKVIITCVNYVHNLNLCNKDMQLDICSCCFFLKKQKTCTRNTFGEPL